MDCRLDLYPISDIIFRVLNKKDHRAEIERILKQMNARDDSVSEETKTTPSKVENAFSKLAVALRRKSTKLNHRVKRKSD